MNDALESSARENKELKEVVKDYGRVKKVIGEEQLGSILERAKVEEHVKTRLARSQNYIER